MTFPITWVTWQEDQDIYYQTMNGRGFTRVSRDVVESDGRHVYREDEIMNMDWDSRSSSLVSSSSNEGDISGDDDDDVAVADAADDAAEEDDAADAAAEEDAVAEEDELTSYGREEEQERMRDIYDVCSYHEDDVIKKEEEGKKEEEVERETCIICTEQINPKKNRAVTDCGHVFCLTCLLRNMYYSISCPLCRTYIINPETVVSHDDYDDYDEQLEQLEQQQQEYDERDEEEGAGREGAGREGAGREGEGGQGENADTSPHITMDVTPDITIVYNLVVNAQKDVIERNRIFRIVVDELADVKREILALLTRGERTEQMITNTYLQIVTARDEIVLIRERDEDEDEERDRDRDRDRDKKREVEREITLLEDVVSQYLFQLNDIYKQINTLRHVEKERMTLWISCHDALKEAKDAEEHTVRLYNSVVTRLCGAGGAGGAGGGAGSGGAGSVCGKLVDPIPVYIWQELPHAVLHQIEL